MSASGGRLIFILSFSSMLLFCSSILLTQHFTQASRVPFQNFDGSTLRQNAVHDVAVDVGQSKVAAGKAVGELLVIEPQ